MSSQIKLASTPIEGLYILSRDIVSDERGFFFRVYCEESLSGLGLSGAFPQINYSFAINKFTTRGCHFQNPPYAETKIVTCSMGAIFDVAIDLREGSKTFLQWFGIVLSEKNGRSLYIPEGFAHGSQSLSNESSLIYLHSKKYSPQNEEGINVFDPMISIKWPGAPANLSKRDKSFPFLSQNFQGVKV